MHTPSEKISLLRSSIAEAGFDAYIIPLTDPHLGEYVPDYWRIIEWLTGFSGSAGTVVVTNTFAGLWTDSRYFIQAEEQLNNTGVMLMRPDGNALMPWLQNNISEGGKVGLDGRLFSVNRLRSIEKSLSTKNIDVDSMSDLIGPLWEDRPELPSEPAFDFPIKFSGKDRSEKIRDLRNEMVKMNVDYHLLSSVDDIMWLLNIRGRDVRYSPVLFSYAIAGMDQILFFADESKISFRLAKEFDDLGIVMLPYDEIAGMLETLEDGKKILLSPESTPAALYRSIPAGIIIREDISIPERFKCVKNNTEINNLGKAMIRDGVALTKFFNWVEQNSGKLNFTELSLTDKLLSFRSDQENFISLSFASIVAFNEHGALPHYAASPKTDIPVKEGLLLVDSGSQYFEGTTDITRTIHLGNVTAEQKKDFTLVLKGMIALSMAAFPSGTYGYQLDMLARKALWENGLNYGHGSGHGVGFCLSVHEGPHRISPLANVHKESYFRPGMIVSDEPAIYREGKYGIRTENLLLCFEDEETEFGKFLRFHTLTLCYIDQDLIDFSLLDKKEKEWLDKYHEEVYERLNPFLSPEESTWLREKTQSR
jgi:Xaa-Pro aminopeptidase